MILSSSPANGSIADAGAPSATDLMTAKHLALREARMISASTLLRRATLTVTACVALGTVASPALAAPPVAEPNAKALEQITWAMSYCDTALTGREDQGPEYYKKFLEKRDAAIAADPSVRAWEGTKSGKKVSEWLPRCEKEIPKRIERDVSDRKLGDILVAAFRICGSGSVGEQDVAKYNSLKADAVTFNQGPDFSKLENKARGLVNVNDKLKTCDQTVADGAARSRKAKEDFDATVAAQNKAHRDKEEAEARWYEEKRATLKGSRRKVWDESGPPGAIHGGKTFANAKEWTYVYRDEWRGIEISCVKHIVFKGNKIAKHYVSGDHCK